MGQRHPRMGNLHISVVPFQISSCPLSLTDSGPDAHPFFRAGLGSGEGIHWAMPVGPEILIGSLCELERVKSQAVDDQF